MRLKTETSLQEQFKLEVSSRSIDEKPVRETTIISDKLSPYDFEVNDQGEVTVKRGKIAELIQKSVEQRKNAVVNSIGVTVAIHE